MREMLETMLTTGEYTPHGYNAIMPTVQVRLFAALRDGVGQREIAVDVAEGATVGDVRDAVGASYPAVKPLLSTTVCAVGEEYVPVTHILREGDLVALIPPVSGGQ
jgi:molybdopterin synthase catalytic subunit